MHHEGQSKAWRSFLSQRLMSELSSGVKSGARVEQQHSSRYLTAKSALKKLFHKYSLHSKQLRLCSSQQDTEQTCLISNSLIRVWAHECEVKINNRHLGFSWTSQPNRMDPTPQTALNLNHSVLLHSITRTMTGLPKWSHYIAFFHGMATIFDMHNRVCINTLSNSQLN